MIALALGITAAMATPLTTPPATGTRSVGSGLAAAGPWADDIPPFTMAWDITNPSAGVYHYAYTFTFDPTRAGGFSHWDLQLTDNCVTPTVDSSCVYNIEKNTTDVLAIAYALFGPGGVDNNFFPPGASNFYGIKFNNASSSSPFIWEFDSSRAPVWGSFFAKSGGGTLVGAWNLGLTNPDSLNELDWIARPNGNGGPGPVIPEPSTMALLGMGGGALLLAKRLRKS